MQSTLEPTVGGRMPYFPALDGVRAWCVLLVMFDHLKSNGHTMSWLNGHLGVDIFFILSGFLITTLLLREEAFTGQIDLWAFYCRRFFRIVPVYAALLLLYVLVLQLPAQAAHWQQFKPAIPYFLSLTNEFAREPNNGSVFLHTWSLGVEEKFYLLWPLLFLASRRLRTAILATLFAVSGLAPHFGQGYLARAYFGLLMGCLMAVLLSSSYAPLLFKRLRHLPPVVPLLLLASGMLAEHLSKNLMFLFSATAVVFVSFLIAGSSWLTRFHASQPLVWLGRRSYSMFLVHILCLNAVESHIRIDSSLKAALVLAGAYGLAVLAGALLYRLIEEPARNRGRRYLARHQEIPAAV